MEVLTSALLTVLGIISCLPTRWLPLNQNTDVYGDPFDGRLEAMLESFRNKSKEYYYASEIQAGETHRLGFPFLNSEDNDQILKDKAAMEEIFVARANHSELSKTHKDWIEWNDKRENHSSWC